MIFKEVMHTAQHVFSRLLNHTYSIQPGVYLPLG